MWQVRCMLIQAQHHLYDTISMLLGEQTGPSLFDRKFCLESVCLFLFVFGGPALVILNTPALCWFRGWATS